MQAQEGTVQTMPPIMLTVVDIAVSETIGSLAH